MGIRIIERPLVDIAPEILERTKASVDESGQVVLHFLYEVYDPLGSAIRIWPTTYLFDVGSDHRSELVHFENITLYPEWTPCKGYSQNHFTLIFSGLPKSCNHFDFIELCNGSGGEFMVTGIERNPSDVYFLKID